MIQDKQVKGYVKVGFGIFCKHFNGVAYEVVKRKLNNGCF
jgi:hypothetical protein